MPPLAGRGVVAEPAVWDDPGVDWAGFDLVVLRSTWDYSTRREEFVTWAGTVPALANSAEVVSWNTDKRYLAELARAGAPVVPTEWVAPDQAWRAPTAGEWVIKPMVGAGGRDAGRYRAGDAAQRVLASRHVARLQAAGRPVMVQPYLPAVDSYGETALVFLAGAYSHAIRKGPMLAGPDRGDVGLYRPERITVRQPTPAERDVAARVLDLVPGGPRRLLYARVDLIPGPDAAPHLVELEVTEPSLYLGYGAGAADRLAAAIAGRLGRRR